MVCTEYPFYTPITQKQIRFFPPSHPPFQLIYTEGIVIILVAFNGSPWFSYGSPMVPLWFIYDSSVVPLWFFYDSSVVPLWFLYGSSMVPRHSLKVERRFLQLLSFSQGAEGNSSLYCWEQEPSFLHRYLLSILTERHTWLPPSPPSKANRGKNNYLPPSPLPLPHSSGYSLFLVFEHYVKFFCTLSYFTHTPPGLHLCIV